MGPIDLSESDEDVDVDSEADELEYFVVPRPQELIYSQLQSSGGSKAKVSKEKVKESSLKKPHRKSKEKVPVKEKYVKMKERKKSILKGKSALGIAMSSKESKRTIGSQELETKFDSYLQGAKKNLKKYQYNHPEPSSKLTPDNPEKLSHQSTPPTTDDCSSQDQLRKRMRERATSAQERYDILNERDSCLRLQDTRRVKPKRKIIKGTCPDMCPEKERYSRVAKNCLSVFEMKMGLDPMSNSKDVDHRFMVKEYSRSSADQQEPLPNELRPVSVLKFTMDYLICNIINRQDGHISVADWYDFIWNRTRSIRKDITQQQLGDMECVDILEKCARFHILCAELLSEEDTATFDPKINNENLTKCLQTLKHMYYDLQTKGIQCPNEAEFRAYDILLSLTEGETLRLVKDIRLEVFKSSHVQAAFQAALAFQSDSYAKFFNLMEKATYLSSCIMHRYMHEARVRALQLIIRSYTVQNKPTMYPLSRLVRNLKFEDGIDAAQFCSWHGLTVDETEVTLLKQGFHKPSSNYPVERSSLLVGKKLETGLGEIVNNGPLPENPLFYYQPVNSFDENGVLMDTTYAIDEEENMSQEELNTSEVSIIDDSSSIPSTIIPPKEHEFPLQASVTKSAAKKLEIFKDKIPDTSFQPAMNSLQSTLSPPSLLKSEVPFEKKGAFAFSGHTENLITQSNNTALPNIPSTSKFFSKGSPTVDKHNTSIQKSPFPETVQTKDQSSMQAASDLSSGSKTPSLNFALKSFKWPDVILEEAAIKDKSVFHLPPLPAAVPETSEGNYLDMLSVENISFMKSDPRENIFESDDMISESEAIAIERISPDINLMNDDYTHDVLIPEEKENTMNAYDREDEDTLRKIRDEKISELVLNIADDVYSQCIEKLAIAISKETVTEEWNKKIELDDYAERMRVYLGRKVLYKWRLFCERKRQRNAYTHFEPLSPWIPMLINTEYVTSGASSPFTVYKKHCSLSRLAETKIKERVMKPGWEPMTAEDFSSMYKHQSLPSAYLKGTGIDQFFKIGIIFPRFMDGSIDLFREWICRKFKLSAVTDVNTKNAKHLSFFSLKGGKTVICFSAVTLDSFTNPSLGNFMNGISAMILCCPASFPDSKAFRSILDQLTKVFKHTNLLAPFPLFAFLFPSEQKFNVVNQLASFLNEHLYSGCVFSAVQMGQLSEISNSENNSKEVVSAVRWLIANQESVPELLHCGLQSFIEDSFISAFNSVFWKLSLPEFKHLYEMPQHTINFYNKMLKCRANLFGTPFLMKVIECWPPQELLVLQPDYSFINSVFLKELGNFTPNLHLPDFDGDPHRLQDMWNYVKAITLTEDADSEMLFISVESVLQNSSNMIDWPSIISKCAFYLIRYHGSVITNYQEDDVYYMKEDLDAIDFKEFWQTVLLSSSEQNINGKKRKTPELQMESVDKKRKNSMSEELYHSLEIEACDLLHVPDIADTTSNRVKDMLNSLQAALNKQAEEEDGFIHKLNESIAGESLFDENNPLDERLVAEKLTIPHVQCKITSKNESSEFSIPDICPRPQHSMQLAGTSSGSSLWRKLIGKDLPSGISSPSSISEKLAELQYNIQRNNILEDNLSLFLDL